MFDEEKWISLAIILSFCLSVHNIHVQPFFPQNFCIIFTRNFRIFLRANKMQKNIFREKREIFGKQFFLLAGNPSYNIHSL